MIKVRTSTFQTKKKNTVTQVWQKKKQLKIGISRHTLFILYKQISNVRKYFQMTSTVKDVLFGLLLSFKLQQIQQHARFIKAYKFQTLKWAHESDVINNETVNIKKRLIILKIKLFFTDITARISEGAVIFTISISIFCKSHLLYLHLFAMSLILQEQIFNFNNTACGGISSGITGMYASPECCQP